MNRISPFDAAFGAAGYAATSETFRSDVIAGLSKPQKSLPSKYFYDDNGAQLFEAITRLPEYYLTRTEMGLLHEHARDIAAIAGPGIQLVEFGGCNSTKARVLLDKMEAPSAYVPIDVYTASLLAEASALTERYPSLQVWPVFADFTRPLTLPDIAPRGRRVGFFPGSTIGNFTPDEAREFLRRVATMLGPDGLLIVGVDMKKNKRLLDDAYNDTAGLTAAFNLNLIERINRELGGNFDLGAFTHCAHYNSVHGRVEMHIYSLAFQTVRVSGHMFAFTPGESIHTENSYKYASADFQNLAREAAFAPLEMWCDPNQLFSLHCLAVETRH